MQCIVSGKGIMITPSMRELVEQKIGRLDHYWSEIIRSHVEVAKSKHHKHGLIFMVYAWLETPGTDVRASAEAGEFQEAIDLLYTKLERLVIKAKERRTRR